MGRCHPRPGSCKGDWFAVAQAAMVGAVLVYFRATPYDNLAESSGTTWQPAFPVAGILLAVGLIARGGNLTQGLGVSRSFGARRRRQFAAVSLALVYVVRWLGNLIMYAKTKLPVAVVEDKNVAAGIHEGLSFLLAALIVTFS